MVKIIRNLAFNTTEIFADQDNSNSLSLYAVCKKAFSFGHKRLQRIVCNEYIKSFYAFPAYVKVSKQPLNGLSDTLGETECVTIQMLW